MLVYLWKRPDVNNIWYDLFIFQNCPPTRKLSRRDVNHPRWSSLSKLVVEPSALEVHSTPCQVHMCRWFSSYYLSALIYSTVSGKSSVRDIAAMPWQETREHLGGGPATSPPQPAGLHASWIIRWDCSNIRIIGCVSDAWMRRLLIQRLATGYRLCSSTLSCWWKMDHFRIRGHPKFWYITIRKMRLYWMSFMISKSVTVLSLDLFIVGRISDSMNRREIPGHAE